MSQHDYVIDNQSSSTARADLNSLFLAIASQNSGATAPATTYANMLWYDTSTDLLKMRNEANTAFISLGTIDQTNNVFAPNFLPVTKAVAEAATVNAGIMTPLRVGEAILFKSNVSGAAPMYACRAWVNFNGTGTVAIRASGNVTSITDNGVGDYTVNLSTAIIDANYSAVGSCNSDQRPLSVVAYSTTLVQIHTSTGTSSSTLTDFSLISLAIFR